MDEHVWYIIDTAGGISAYCRDKKCTDILDTDDINRRLNATERLEEVNKGLFNIIKAYHPAYIDGCECPQCSEMPIYFDDTLEEKC